MATMIDDELKQLASLALANAYFRDAQALVAKYRTAAAGLGSDMETGQAQVEMHCWGEKGGGELADHHDIHLNLHGTWKGPHAAVLGDSSCGYQTMLEALDDDRAEEIHLQGECVFVRKDGEWYWAQS